VALIKVSWFQLIMGDLLSSWLKIKQAASFVRLKPFDTSTTEGRSKERYRRIALTSVTAIAAKGIGVLTALVSVPLTIDYLGVERYGLWITISSVIALLSFADLGIGNGLLNAVAEADGKDDRDAACRYVSSAFFILLGIAIFLLAILISVYSFIPWQRVYNVTSDLAVRESGSATALLIAIFFINMPLGIVQRVQTGYQEGFRNHLWAIAGALAGFVGLLVVVYFKWGLQWLVLAVSGGPVLVMLMNWFREFTWLKPWLFPRWSSFDWSTGCKIVNTGLLFLILQIFAIIGNSSDNIVIAQVLGASAVASYAVTQKLFSVTQIAQFFILPLWPAFGEAMARNETAWARRTLNRSLILSLVLGVFTAFPFLIFGKQIIAWWVGSALIPSTIMLIGFALWVLLAGYGGSMSSFLNSGSLLGKQTIFYSVASIASLILKIVLTKVWQSPAGVIWATVFGYGIFYVIPAAMLSYGSLRQKDPIRSTV
jgi:O-antigen/teichoic acid export membrane protein